MTEATLEQAAGARPDLLTHLQHAIELASHLLPAQGRITVFVHHNTLHAFEELTFHEAVQKASKIFDCQPYLSEECTSRN